MRAGRRRLHVGEEAQRVRSTDVRREPIVRKIERTIRLHHSVFHDRTVPLDSVFVKNRVVDLGLLLRIEID